METGNLRNEDFRKLLTQKRTEPVKAPGGGATGEKKEQPKGAAFSHKQAAKQQYKKKGGAGHKHKQKEKKKAEGDEEDEEDEDERLKEILKNYRDRAAERRTKGDEPEMDPQMAAAYRAVPGDKRALFDAHMKRQQAIEESKYLGGDMEHTHLVKGLDYSLLNKVRAEITKTRNTDEVPEDEDEALEVALASRNKKEKRLEDEKQPESVLARNVQRILFKTEMPLRNELFGKGRMAYVVELDDEASDVPTTLLRSLHDCPVTESNATVNANNMLITKLTQVLSYLRTDLKKKGRKDEYPTAAEQKKAAEASIYDDVGEYVPKREKEKGEERKEREGDRREKRDYFGDGRRDDRDRDRRDRERDRDRDDGRDRHRDDHRDRRREDRDREDREREKRRAEERQREELQKRFDEQKRLDEKLAKRKRDTEGYDECYPGGIEMGVFNDSDEDEEEPASKKGRSAWGEEDNEKFNKSSRKSEVKAAYQFGVKKGDGRKSGKQQDKRLDQELDKINKIMEKRKTEGTEAPKMRY